MSKINNLGHHIDPKRVAGHFKARSFHKRFKVSEIVSWERGKTWKEDNESERWCNCKRRKFESDYLPIKSVIG